MFECLTLLKLEVIENGLQTGLKCVLRYIDFFKRKSRAGPPDPTNERGVQPPSHTPPPSRPSPLGSRLRLSMPPTPRQQLVWVRPWHYDVHELKIIIISPFPCSTQLSMKFKLLFHFAIWLTRPYTILQYFIAVKLKHF